MEELSGQLNVQHDVQTTSGQNGIVFSWDQGLTKVKPRFHLNWDDGVLTLIWLSSLGVS